MNFCSAVCWGEAISRRRSWVSEVSYCVEKARTKNWLWISSNRCKEDDTDKGSRTGNRQFREKLLLIDDFLEVALNTNVVGEVDWSNKLGFFNCIFGVYCCYSTGKEAILNILGGDFYYDNNCCKDDVGSNFSFGRLGCFCFLLTYRGGNPLQGDRASRSW